MNINRHNYEEFFLLYVDNELSTSDRKEVEAFVEQHPDLAQELELLKEAVIHPADHISFNKQELFRTADDSNSINAGNFEEYFLLHADKELSAEEENHLTSFLAQHPEFRQLLDRILQTRLTPEEVVFPDKQLLYRPIATARIWGRNSWRIAAAAIVVLLASLFWIYTPRNASNTETLAEGNINAKEDSSIDRKTNTLPNAAPSSAKAAAEPVTAEQVKAKKDMPRSNDIVANRNGQSRPEKKQVVHQAQRQAEDKQRIVNKITEEPEENTMLVTRNLKTGRERLYTRKEVEVTDPNPSHFTMHAVAAVEPEEAEAFASEQKNAHVFLANIPVENNPTLKSFFRKAGRIINKVSALKKGEGATVSVGQVEIAFQ